MKALVSEVLCLACRACRACTKTELKLLLSAGLRARQGVVARLSRRVARQGHSQIPGATARHQRDKACRAFNSAEIKHLQLSATSATKVAQRACRANIFGVTSNG